jgi:hypothetical protein
MDACAHKKLGTSTEKFQTSLLLSPRQKNWASQLPCSLISLADMWLYLAQGNAKFELEEMEGTYSGWL